MLVLYGDNTIIENVFYGNNTISYKKKRVYF